MTPMTLELWQTKWCPASHRVRQRLTELGLTYTNRQVPVDPYRRAELEIATGLRTSPTLIADDHILAGEEVIFAYLGEHYPEPAGALARRENEGNAQVTRARMSEVGSSYTLSTDTDLNFLDAVTRVREELAAEGFGVLCEIDVQATLRKKLGVEREPYLILGACNPPLARDALEAEPELGVLLPCNVVVYQHEGQTRIAAVDAERMLSVVGNDGLATTASEVRRRLSAVIERAA
jgi:uncharacterized protein (DUF302 family)/glutaredoxin